MHDTPSSIRAGMLDGARPLLMAVCAWVLPVAAASCSSPPVAATTVEATLERGDADSCFRHRLVDSLDERERAKISFVTEPAQAALPVADETVRDAFILGAGDLSADFHVPAPSPYHNVVVLLQALELARHYERVCVNDILPFDRMKRALLVGMLRVVYQTEREKYARWTARYPPGLLLRLYDGYDAPAHTLGAIAGKDIYVVAPSPRWGGLGRDLGLVLGEGSVAYVATDNAAFAGDVLPSIPRDLAATQIVSMPWKNEVIREGGRPGYPLRTSRIVSPVIIDSEYFYLNDHLEVWEVRRDACRATSQ